MPKNRTRIATPPGTSIRERLETLGMSQREFASRMDYSEKHVCQLIKGDVQLTQETAARLETVLGSPARFWNGLESDYREKLLAARRLGDLGKDRAVARTFPYDAMAQNRWVPKAKNPTERVVNLRKFFEVVRLTLLKERQLYPRVICQQSDVNLATTPALLAWLQQAKCEARRIPTGRIDIDALYDFLPAIRELTNAHIASDVGGAVICPRLTEKLAACGIALVFVPQLEGNPLYASSFLNGPRIVLAMAPDNPSGGTFWLDMLHELGHIALHHDRHPGDAERNEQEATLFARCLLGLQKVPRRKAPRGMQKQGCADHAA